VDAGEAGGISSNNQQATTNFQSAASKTMHGCRELKIEVGSFFAQLSLAQL
jgi:hypothetical protein